jgi:hypothetical protein
MSEAAIANAKAAAPALPLRQGILVWLGQLLTMLIVSATEFGLGIWTYERNGSALEFSAILVCAVVPGLVAAPWGGALADRADRRLIILAADCVELLLLALTAALLWQDALQLWHIYAVNGVFSVSLAYRVPAYQAALGAMLPRRHFARLLGMLRTGNSVVLMLSPMVAAAVMATAGLASLLAGGAAILFLALLPLLLIRFPTRLEPAHAHEGSDLRAFAEAARYLWRQPMLAFLTVYGTAVCFLRSMAMTLFVPLALATQTPATLAWIQSVGSAGLLASSVAVAAFGLPRRLVPAMLVLDIVFGIAIVLLGAAGSKLALAAAMFAAMGSVALRLAAYQTFWQLTVPDAMQGRVFALNGALMSAAAPLAAIVGGLLADEVFAPLLASGAPWTEALRFGAGGAKAQGIALMFAIGGALSVLAAAGALLHPALRRLDAAHAQEALSPT